MSDQSKTTTDAFVVNRLRAKPDPKTTLPCPTCDGSRTIFVAIDGEVMCPDCGYDKTSDPILKVETDKPQTTWDGWRSAIAPKEHATDRLRLEATVRNLRANGGVIVSKLAADLIQEALGLKDQIP